MISSPSGCVFLQLAGQVAVGLMVRGPAPTDQSYGLFVRECKEIFGLIGLDLDVRGWSCACVRVLDRLIEATS